MRHGQPQVLFEFKDPSDVERVLKGEPRSFDKNLVALKRVSRHTDVRNSVFDRTSFWVLVHNLPIGSFPMGVAKEVVSVAGVVDESETKMGNGEGCNFLRVRVFVNPSDPLCKGTEIGWKDGSASQVSFKRERLHNPHDFERILDGVDVVVTEDMRIDLARPFTSKEVDATIKDMAQLKTTRPDGMPHLFYQTYW